MYQLDHPNIARLEYTFQDQASLFFIMEYAPNGDLSGIIKKEKKLSTELTRFFACEIINALEYMRKHNVAHRDLKPENILLDSTCHLKVSDFGDSKVVDTEDIHERLMRESFVPELPKMQNYSVDPEFEENFDFGGNYEPSKNEENKMVEPRGESFVGTPLYVSPEMLNHNIASFCNDIWAFGCILYQCAWGAPPFNGFTEAQIYEKINTKKIFYPDFLDPKLKDLIDKMIQVDPKERLGAGITEGNGIDKLKAHEFFEGIDFDDIINQTVPLSENLRLAIEVQKKANNVTFKVNDMDSDDESNMGTSLHKVQSEANLNSKKILNEGQLSSTMNPKQVKDIGLKDLLTKSALSSIAKITSDTIKESVVEK